MNNVKEKIEFLEKQLEGAKKLKNMSFLIHEPNTIGEDIELIESMIKDYKNVGQTIENDSLIIAVKTIKEHCKNQDGVNACENCPLGRINGDCIVIESSPCDWNINNTSKILI